MRGGQTLFAVDGRTSTSSTATLHRSSFPPSPSVSLQVFLLIARPTSSATCSMTRASDWFEPTSSSSGVWLSSGRCPGRALSTGFSGVLGTRAPSDGGYRGGASTRPPWSTQECSSSSVVHTGSSPSHAGGATAFLSLAGFGIACVRSHRRGHFGGSSSPARSRAISMPTSGRDSSRRAAASASRPRRLRPAARGPSATRFAARRAGTSTRRRRSSPC
jgi:hypothetical protein